jgi:hypothetical protein
VFSNQLKASMADEKPRTYGHRCNDPFDIFQNHAIATAGFGFHQPLCVPRELAANLSHDSTPAASG